MNRSFLYVLTLCRPQYPTVAGPSHDGPLRLLRGMCLSITVVLGTNQPEVCLARHRKSVRKLVRSSGVPKLSLLLVVASTLVAMASNLASE